MIVDVSSNSAYVLPSAIILKKAYALGMKEFKKTKNKTRGQTPLVEKTRFRARFLSLYKEIPHFFLTGH